MLITLSSEGKADRMNEWAGCVRDVSIIGGGGCKSIRTERSSKTRDWTQTKQMEADCGERRFEGDKETREEDEDEGEKEEERKK